MCGATPPPPPTVPMHKAVHMHKGKFTVCYLLVDRDSSVGIATRYGLDGPGIDSRWGRDIPHLSRPTLGLTQSPVQSVQGHSWG
jgi:hypothetical protein